jgi:hypothetical protein
VPSRENQATPSSEKEETEYFVALRERALGWLWHEPSYRLAEELTTVLPVSNLQLGNPKVTIRNFLIAAARGWNNRCSSACDSSSNYQATSFTTSCTTASCWCDETRQANERERDNTLGAEARRSRALRYHQLPDPAPLCLPRAGSRTQCQ